MNFQSKIKDKNNLLLLLIVFAAVLLRFYHFDQIPFTHDEFSALFRTQFDNFQNLVRYGVCVDGHPAGVQLFLYYWTHWFGTTEWIVKLPFTLAGIGAVVLIFFIGKLWFNPTVGLIAASFTASMQYMVMNSQIARPYMSGLFITLFMFYCWSHLILHPERKFYSNLVGYIIACTGAVYNHYFSFLFALIIGIIGIFLISGKRRFAYLISGGIVFLLFLPHWPITMAHLRLKGIEGWLGKPSPTFLIEYLSYLFHHSIYLISLVIIIIIYGIFTLKKDFFSRQKFFLFSTLFFLPILIGYLYSTYINAVLQYSVLIFTFPYLFFVIFGHLKEQKFAVNLLLTGSILITASITLILERKHFDLFYKSVYEKIITDYPGENKDSTLFLVYSNRSISDYYLNKNPHIHNVIFVDSFAAPDQLDLFLQQQSEHYTSLYWGAISSVPPNLFPIIKNYYPTIEEEHYYFSGETCLCSKKKSNNKYSKTIADFHSSKFPEDWQQIDMEQLIYNDSLGKFPIIHIPNEKEWNCAYTFQLGDIEYHHNDFIDIEIIFSSEDRMQNIEVVSTLHNGEKQIFWSSTNLMNFNPEVHYSKGWHRAIHSVKLADIQKINKNTQVDIFLWNKEKKQILIQDIRISLRKGNPYLYGIYEKIEE